MLQIALNMLETMAGNAAAAEENVRRWVAVARDMGATWDQIADALGVSKPKAHKRWAGVIGPVDEARRQAAERLDAFGRGDGELPE